MKMFRVRNFEKFQHYKDRNPPWIKFYADVLDDYEVATLPDASKAHLFAIWLLASRNNNEIPCDSGWIERRINATSGIDLDELHRLGFIEYFDASKPIAKCSPETETEYIPPPPKGGAPPKAGKRVRELANLSIDADLIAYAEQHGVTHPLERELEKFRRYCGGKGRRYKDYRQAFQNWLLNAEKFGGPANGRRHQPTEQAAMRGIFESIADELEPDDAGTFGRGGTA